MFEKQVRLFLIFLALFILQYSCFSLLPIKGTFPDLLAILTVFYAQYVRKSRLVIFALCMGLVQDLFSSGFFGVIAVSYMVAAYPLYYLVRKLPEGRMMLGMLMVACYTVLVQTQVLCFSLITDGYYGFSNGFMAYVVPTVVYTVCMSVIVLWVLHFVMRDSLRQYNLF